MFKYIGAIASSVISKKKKETSKKKSESEHPINKVTKKQQLKWVEEGVCQCCGADSGKYKDICDNCLYI